MQEIDGDSLTHTAPRFKTPGSCTDSSPDTPMY